MDFLSMLFVAALYCTKSIFICSVRMFYPYSSFISNALQISSTTYFNALSLQEISGAFSMAISPIFDTISSEIIIFGSLLINSISLTLLAVFPSYYMFIASRICSGFFVTVLDSSIQHLVGSTRDVAILGRG